MDTLPTDPLALAVALTAATADDILALDADALIAARPLVLAMPCATDGDRARLAGLLAAARFAHEARGGWQWRRDYLGRLCEVVWERLQGGDTDPHAGWEAEEDAQDDAEEAENERDHQRSLWGPQ